MAEAAASPTHAESTGFCFRDTTPSSAADGGWLGKLDMRFAPLAGKTRLVSRSHVGPLVVQRPFHPETDGTTHVYVLHPPGGIAGGDRLELTCVLDAGARTLLTTPGAGKIYRTAGGPGRMTTEIEVGPGAVCEYLPQETILFDGADARIETRVRLARDATYLGWDFLCLGRPAAGEGFGKGAVRQRVEVIRAGRPIWYERLDLPAGSPHLQARFSLAGQPIVATMVYAGPMLEGTDERIRAEAGEDAPGVFSVSQLEDVVVCRYLGASMTQAKTLFGRAWQVLRAGPMGKRAVAPRIWAT
ncbi:urease accessory protein UreD (plasmid) [Paracoccus yeei]|uniref:urease accessory protein UreD n=1 Tax=Paracoccus yeei TaxID=147645 RepID=UPI003BF7AC16